MKMKHHFNVIIDATDSCGELDQDEANIKSALGGMYETAEVTLVETFDAESDEEIRTHALVQDAMDGVEARGEGWKK